jgi:hypothetical protein
VRSEIEVRAVAEGEMRRPRVRRRSGRDPETRARPGWPSRGATPRRRYSFAREGRGGEACPSRAHRLQARSDGTPHCSSFCGRLARGPRDPPAGGRSLADLHPQPRPVRAAGREPGVLARKDHPRHQRGHGAGLRPLARASENPQPPGQGDRSGPLRDDPAQGAGGLPCLLRVAAPRRAHRRRAAVPEGPENGAPARHHLHGGAGRRPAGDSLGGARRVPRRGVRGRPGEVRAYDIDDPYQDEEGCWIRTNKASCTPSTCWA